jgi:hypothetical protein
MRDLYHNVDVVKMLNAIVGNNDTEGLPSISIDTLGFGSSLAVALIGISDDSPPTAEKVEVIAEESDDDITFTAITTASHLLGATPNGSGVVYTWTGEETDDTTVKVGYVGYKRYFRLRFDFTGTFSSGLPIAMVGLRGHPNTAPVA